MTDQDARHLRRLVKRYGPYTVVVNVRQVMDTFPGAKWSLCKHRVRQLEYASGVAEGRLKLLRVP